MAAKFDSESAPSKGVNVPLKEIRQKDNPQQSKCGIRIREPLPGHPVFLKTINCNDIKELKPGDHILHQSTHVIYRNVFWSALVIDSEKSHKDKLPTWLKIMSNYEEGGVLLKEVPVYEFHNLHKVEYSPCQYSDEQAVFRARKRIDEDHYDPLCNNSHHFVTWCKTGREHSLTDILRSLEYDLKGTNLPREEGLNHVTLATPVCSIDKLCSGQHVVEDSKLHYLIDTVDTQRKQFSVYSINDQKLVIHEDQISWKPSTDLKILTCRSIHTNSSFDARPESSLKQAADELKAKTKWASSDCFVTAMTCGVQHPVKEMYMMNHDVVPTGCTLITRDVTVDEGDHLVITDVSNELKSVIVLEHLDSARIRVKPSLAKSEIINLSTYPETYRIDYSGSLPATEVIKRANSQLGEKYLQNNSSDHFCFASWAKTSKEDNTYSVQQRISYERITSFEEIKSGDHLVQCLQSDNERKLLHLIALDPGKEDECTLKTVSCDHTNLITENSQNLTEQELYRINYSASDSASVDIEESMVTSVPKVAKTGMSILPPEVVKVESTTLKVIERARSHVGKRLHNPWSPMMFITWAKRGGDENFIVAPSRMPNLKEKIKCFDQLKPGDYLVVKPHQRWSHHYLVVSIESPLDCTVIEFPYKGKVSISTVAMTLPELSESESDKFPWYYHVKYDLRDCYPAQDSIDTAKKFLGRSKIADGINHLSFIHYLKTGKKVEISIDDLQTAVDHAQHLKLSRKGLNVPLLIQTVTNLSVLARGDHILYRVDNTPPFHPVYRSAIVQATLPEDSIEIVTVTTNGISTEILEFHSSVFHQVIYKIACCTNEQVLTHVIGYLKKKNYPQYDEHKNNSHHFAVCCKIGKKQHSLMEFLVKFVAQEPLKDKKILKPVLIKEPLNGKSVKDLKSGDHIVVGSHHYLIEEVEYEHDKIKTFTINFHKKIDKVELDNIQKLIQSKQAMFRIKYDPHTCTGNGTQAMFDIVKMEIQKKSKWLRSDQFVTMIKCGTAHIVDERCMINDDITINGCTLVSCYTSVDEGDHLLIKDKKDPEKFHSVLVCTFISPDSVITIPYLDESEVVNLTDGVIYRVNYSESLPSAEVIERAQSYYTLQRDEKDINYDSLVTWAKTGKIVKLDVKKIVKDEQIEKTHPLEYRKILSVDEFQTGQHIFINSSFGRPYREHMLISECSMDSKCPTKFKVIRCLHTAITEEIMDLDPGHIGKDIYQVLYQDELPTERALERAKSLVHTHKLHPLARMWLVPWAKTGSENGIEVDFLKNLTRPVSKSKIVCFTQLNDGDYLVEQQKKIYHHYLVKSIESPKECTIFESWRGWIRMKVLQLGKKNSNANSNSNDEYPLFYRINYETEICILAKQSLENAENLIHTQKWPYLPQSEGSRRSCIHYLKTGELASINIDELQDDRTLLLREVVKSALDLKPGDHIERPLSLAPKHAQHHMFVVEPLDEKHCEVIHYKVQKRMLKKGEVTREIVNIFEQTVCFRICYPERIDPKKGMARLIQLCGEEGKEILKRYTGKTEYSLTQNNCEHLVTIGTLGIPLSVQVENFLHQALQTGSGVVKSLRISCLHRSASLSKICTMHGACQLHIGHHAAVRPVGQAVAKVGVKIGLKAATSASVLGAVAGASFIANIIIEGPLLARSIYKLERQRKFQQISPQDFKRKRDTALITATNSIIGGTLGAVAGQAVIPVPIAGAAIGGMLGNFAGYTCGHIEAKLYCLLRYPGICGITLPEIVLRQYQNLSDLGIIKVDNIEENLEESWILLSIRH